MKQKHLFSLLDNSATTIRVVFPKDEVARQEISGQLQKRFNDPPWKRSRGPMSTRCRRNGR